MKYRVAQPADYSAITKCIASTGYYEPNLRASELVDGLTAVAVENGEVVACLWAMVCGRHAFLDYYAAVPGTPGTVPVKLAFYMQDLLRACGVRYIKTAISMDNLSALKIAGTAGMRGLGGYALVTKELTYGNQEAGNRPDHADADRAEVGAGE